jgi:NAD+ synthase
MNAKAVCEYIIQWMRDYAQNAGISGFVVGMSGGIDSAVCASLAARTHLSVHLAELSIHQHPQQVERALKHMEHLCRDYPKTQTHRIDLSPPFDVLAQTLPHTKSEVLDQLCFANARSRLRMITLYHIAAMHRCLVVGTGNKVEDFGVGFYTKYGDGGVDLSPIADLNKTEVYTLGAYLGVNQEIMEAPPTDGLFGDSRTDAEQIGATYPELEWAMEFEKNPKTLESLTDRQREVLALYRRMHRANLHKMLPIPVCVIPEGVKSAY